MVKFQDRFLRQNPYVQHKRKCKNVQTTRLMNREMTYYPTRNVRKRNSPKYGLEVHRALLTNICV